jgi:hypothetical protein
MKGVKRLLLAVALALPLPSQAQGFCVPEEQFFQEQPTPATPRERVNSINLSSCSSGMPCLNQLRASMTRTQPMPTAHRWVKREPPKQPCLQSVPMGNGQSNAAQ